MASLPASFECEGRTYPLSVRRIALLTVIFFPDNSDRPIVTVLTDRTVDQPEPGAALH